MKTMKFGDREFPVVGLLLTEGIGTLPILNIPMMDDKRKPTGEQQKEVAV